MVIRRVIRSCILFLGIVATSLVIAGTVARSGYLHVDDHHRYGHSQDLISAFQGKTVRSHRYAPLWELMLGGFTEIAFPHLQDPFWIRTTVTFAFFPIGLFLLYWTSVAAGLQRWHALLATVAVFGIPRLGGHALYNVKDFPVALTIPIVSVAIWHLFTRLSKAKKDMAVLYLATIGVLAVLPFMLRAPLLQTFLIAIGALTLIALSDKAKGMAYVEKIALIALPLATAFATIYYLSPTMWNASILGTGNGIADVFTLFSNYPTPGNTRFMGMNFVNTNVPWWYPFAWLLVSINPVVQFTAAIGVLLLLFMGSRGYQKRTLKFFSWWKIHFSFVHWIWMIVMTSWFGIICIGPNLYDEDRHFLFLYPITVYFAILGFRNCNNQILRYGLITIVFTVSCFSYMQWGRYSYVYKSPIIGNTHTSQFQGDYWGLCIAKAVNALKDRVPPNTQVNVQLEHIIALNQYNRLRNSAIVQDTSFGPYIIRAFGDGRDKRPLAVISTNRDSSHIQTVAHIAQGRAKLLWADTMPPGKVPTDYACLLAIFE